MLLQVTYYLYKLDALLAVIYSEAIHDLHREKFQRPSEKELLVVLRIVTTRIWEG